MRKYVPAKSRRRHDDCRAADDGKDRSGQGLQGANGGLSRNDTNHSVGASGGGAGTGADGGHGGEAGCHGTAAASTAGRPFHKRLEGVDARIGPLDYVGFDLLGQFQ